ncbi:MULTISPECIES: hypothetical protein [Clostridium]|uniref:Restriction endonuclease n=1 Tax=Clostridium faecium TaxID=2762223 RepID=A0ABR8YSE1_9CLOT|nr:MULTISPECIES: hypothetical protein [Clostridium]MBD8047148.1 hypothetical protein [Clostridium faecium]MDU1348471.1 hypothetical protein [Clostridium argentinense]
MTNKNCGVATQGSRLYLQQYMVNAEDKLSEMIIAASPSLLIFAENKSNIDWKSPLEKCSKGEFYEYRDDFLEVLNLEDERYKKAKENLREFWPKNGPQWDGLAVVNGINGEKGFLLVEAKAHLDETKSDLKAVSNQSINKIKKSISRTQEYYGIETNDWTKNYYQLGNRIAYLYFMNEILKIPTWLVLINFTDGEYKKTELYEWLKHYNQIYTSMGINLNSKLLNNIIQIFIKAL